MSILINKFPAKEHTQKVLSHLPKSDNAIFYLKGEVTKCRHNTDCDIVFRQESNFFYLTGVEKAGFQLVVEVATGKSTLFAPDVDEADIMWLGLPAPLSSIQEKYDVDQVLYASELPSFVEKLNPSTVHVFTDVLDAKAVEKYEGKFERDNFKIALEEARMVKTEYEIQLMLEANRIASEAHIELFKNTKANMNERELHALFAYTCHRQGSSGLGYNPIVGAGLNSAILHYGDNNSQIENNGDLILVDAGCDYRFYASDITRVYPVGGKFTEDGKNLYNAVLDMQNTVLAALKHGVKYEDMHYLAMGVAAKHLIKMGICNGTPEELVKNHVVAVFFPHGLGHSIGLDVHDVGGYPKGVERIDAPGVRYLRMRRTLEEGNVITVEPGIYFAEPLIEFARKDSNVAKYLNNDVVDRFIKIGGVRIEDDVVITKDGYRNLTTVPKTVEEIEALCVQSA